VRRVRREAIEVGIAIKKYWNRTVVRRRKGWSEGDDSMITRNDLKTHAQTDTHSDANTSTNASRSKDC